MIPLSLKSEIAGVWQRYMAEAPLTLQCQLALSISKLSEALARHSHNGCGMNSEDTFYVGQPQLI